MAELDGWKSGLNRTETHGLRKVRKEAGHPRHAGSQTQGRRFDLGVVVVQRWDKRWIPQTRHKHASVAEEQEQVCTVRGQVQDVQDESQPDRIKLLPKLRLQGRNLRNVRRQGDPQRNLIDMKVGERRAKDVNDDEQRIRLWLIQSLRTKRSARL